MRVGEVRMIDGRLSLVTNGEPYPCNFWFWKTIRKDGTLGKEYKGYNNGTHIIGTPIKHEVVIKVDTFDLLKKVKQ